VEIATRVLGAAFLALFALSPVGVSAQDEEERASESGGGYAWGEGARAALPDDPLRVIATAGVGVGVRPLRNIDTPFSQDFLAPAFLDVGAAVFAPGGDVRHGGGLVVTTGVTTDGIQSGGVASFTQWVLTPSYFLLVPLRRLIPSLGFDWVHLQGRVGLPLSFSAALGRLDGVDVTVGAEVAAAVHFKFLAGLGLYLELTAAVYGGSSDTVHPVLSADAGLLFDYEVLP
jgi:hypothetical protein